MFLKSSLHDAGKMRTKGQRRVNQATLTRNRRTADNRSASMFAQITTVLYRSRATLLEDAAGVAALTVMLLVGLHLPGVH